MHIMTAAEMQKIDSVTIHELGIPGLLLMENAGISVVESFQEHFDIEDPVSILIVCGKGNNGGDGFVCARQLKKLGHRVRVILLGAGSGLKGDPAVNFNAARNSGIEITEAVDPEKWNQVRHLLHEHDYIFDGIFGTGLIKAASGLYADVIEEMNRSASDVISIDIPSGISSDTGKIIGPSVEAALTVTFGSLKHCHVFPPAESLCGRVVLADIGFPGHVVQKHSSRVHFLTPDRIAGAFPPRQRTGHKGTYGHLLVMAGSRGKTGAAVLAGEGALRTGAGLVTIATPASSQPVVASRTTEAMTEPLPETEHGTISMKALKEALALANKMSAVALGPGLGTYPETQAFVKQFIQACPVPMVIDADGSNALAGSVEILKNCTQDVVITPHPGEMARLISSGTQEILEHRIDICRKFASANNVYTVLKGYRSLIVSPAGEVYVNSTGNPGMGSGGTGDLLTGMVGGLLCQRVPAFEAAIAATCLHGFAADLAAAEKGEYALIAGDIRDAIPAAMRELKLFGG